MPKTLLQQALEHKDVPIGTMEKPGKNGFTCLVRPKNTECPFEVLHKSNRNCWIRYYGYCGYQLGCYGGSCRGKTIERDTQGGLTKDELIKENERLIKENKQLPSEQQLPSWSADMF